MTDIENKVIDTIIRAVEIAYPAALVEDRYNPSPASFPHAAVYELSNTNIKRYVDNLENELYSSLTYEVQVSANDKYKKSTAKAIASLIDGEMRGMGFLRTFKHPVPNVDRTVYRIVMRYSAIVRKGILSDDEKTTTFLMYQ